MDDNFIDVDTVETAPPLQENEPGPSSRPMALGARRSARPRPPVGTYATLRRRSMSPEGTSKRAGRSTPKQFKKKGSAKNEASAPKLKLKLGDRSSALNSSFLGPWDRELDSDDEDLAFEEQFILRMPEGDDCERLRKMVLARDVQDDVWFKFKGVRASPTQTKWKFMSPCRFPTRDISHWRYDIQCKARRSPCNHRIPKDVRQPSNV
jgi:transcription initiation factor TFIID subunit 7